MRREPSSAKCITAWSRCTPLNYITLAASSGHQQQDQQANLGVCMQDFLKNNRGINDGGDLPQDYMIALYDRIVNDEIKMKVCNLTNTPLT